MTAAWNGAPPPVLPPPTPAERLRLAWRAPAAAIWTLLLFAAFRLLRRPGIIRAWAAGALWLAGLRLVVRGEPMAGKGAFLANHSSWLDIVALQRVAAPFFVAKAEVGAWPGIGTIARGIGTMFVDRRGTEAKRQGETLQSRLAQGDRMALFPEGTSTDGNQVLAFKSALFGVFLTPDIKTLPLQPVTVAYRPKAGLPETFYGWWGEMDFARHLLQVLMRSRNGTVELAFHPPLSPADFPDRKALAEAAQAAVAAGRPA